MKLLSLCFFYTFIGKTLRVVSTDRIFDVVEAAHTSNSLIHAGARKVEAEIHKEYYGIPRSYVRYHVANCPVCQLSAMQTSKPPLKPIIEKQFLSRIQVDLIDLNQIPDGEYKYICHVIDHFTKYHILFPLRSKTAAEVAYGLEERVLAYVGLPKIFHSDNGREFVNAVLKSLFDEWGGDTVFITGRPRHSQSQGCVERGNRTVQDKIGNYSL